MRPENQHFGCDELEEVEKNLVGTAVMMSVFGKLPHWMRRQSPKTMSDGLAISLHVVDGKTVSYVGGGALRRALRFLAAPFVSSWHHRDLINTVLRRELYERFKGSMAGWVWALVAPLLSLATYTLVFAGAVNLPAQVEARSQFDYALFIFGGIIAFNLFTEMAYRAPSLMQEYSHFIKLTMFPPEMLPIISTLRATVYSSVGLALMLVAEVVLTGTFYWTSILLPLWLIPFVAFLIGLTWFFSAIGSFTRDVSYAMMTIAPLLMFATPVFFSSKGLPPPVDLLIYLNIMTGYIEIVRDLVFFGRLPNGLVCLWTFAMSAVTFWGGYWFFIRNRDGIADVL